MDNNKNVPIYYSESDEWRRKFYIIDDNGQFIKIGSATQLECMDDSRNHLRVENVETIIANKSKHNKGVIMCKITDD